MFYSYTHTCPPSKIPKSEPGISFLVTDNFWRLVAHLIKMEQSRHSTWSCSNYAYFWFLRHHFGVMILYESESDIIKMLAFMIDNVCVMLCSRYSYEYQLCFFSLRCPLLFIRNRIPAGASQENENNGF
jgi:hypothetical protein